ncbi:alpha/beta fold hydrolase [Roseinatronobacter alkalisoli]|uniref:Alpha/beta hydrolase n=1 Tax=Roseinatronobacter alkalisoli TaxID=3028235 RepID=A0ABT5TCN0_9RHOB|nr:alpha/beta hydrolase [Roseinatronobacter sp. HJB301]MDD7972756.1 alpha/beta hydrolase [Roseinatronobacter sp. HJB301]
MSNSDTTLFLELDPDNAIHAIHHSPQGDKATFVFLNSMGATTQVWEETLAPALRARGFGTLSFDYRGQGKTRFGPDATLTPAEIISDTGTVLARIVPRRPILVGLSIGGLFGASALLAGAQAEGLVLINTLRKQNAQVEWINTLEERLIGIGGMPLVLDVLRPVLSGVDQLEKLRTTHLPEEGYTPWPADHPRRRLAEGVKQAQWDIAWQDLSLPVLVMTGLQDRLFRIQPDVDELTARLPDARTVTYADGGHSLQAEHPDSFVADLAEFAASLGAA